MDAQTPVGFTLQKITTEQFAVIESGFEEKGNIKLKIDLRFAADVALKIVSVFTAFTFESDQKPFIVIEAGCHFNILDETWEKMCRIEEKKIDLPMGLITHLAVLTIGTTRGILHAKTENTCFNKYLLPTINVTQLIKEDVVFGLE